MVFFLLPLLPLDTLPDWCFLLVVVVPILMRAFAFDFSEGLLQPLVGGCYCGPVPAIPPSLGRPAVFDLFEKPPESACLEPCVPDVGTRMKTTSAHFAIYSLPEVWHSRNPNTLHTPPRLEFWLGANASNVPLYSPPAIYITKNKKEMKTLLLSIAAATAASTFSLLPSYADAQTGIITAQRPWEAKLKAHASLKDGTKRCLFLHGVGEDTDGPATSTYEDYWGKVHEHTPQCGERVFWHRDTSNMAFNDPRLVNYYCSLIKAPSGVVNG